MSDSTVFKVDQRVEWIDRDGTRLPAKIIEVNKLTVLSQELNNNSRRTFLWSIDEGVWRSGCMHIETRCQETYVDYASGPQGRYRVGEHFCHKPLPCPDHSPAIETQVLRKCPFCGGDGVVESEQLTTHGDRQWWVRCRSCAAQGPWFKNVEAGAVRMWNTRVAPGDAGGKEVTGNDAEWLRSYAAGMREWIKGGCDSGDPEDFADDPEQLERIAKAVDDTLARLAVSEENRALACAVLGALAYVETGDTWDSTDTYQLGDNEVVLKALKAAVPVMKALAAARDPMIALARMIKR